jgi:hypothetical protein
MHNRTKGLVRFTANQQRRGTVPLPSALPYENPLAAFAQMRRPRQHLIEAASATRNSLSCLSIA